MSSPERLRNGNLTENGVIKFKCMLLKERIEIVWKSNFQINNGREFSRTYGKTNLKSQGEYIKLINTYTHFSSFQWPNIKNKEKILKPTLRRIQITYKELMIWGIANKSNNGGNKVFTSGSCQVAPVGSSFPQKTTTNSGQDIKAKTTIWRHWPREELTLSKRGWHWVSFLVLWLAWGQILGCAMQGC